jgi:GT2 family glycosyltransferase
LLFLNPDTKILGTALSDMRDCLDSISEAGALGCRILNADGTVQTTAIQAFPTLLNQLFDTETLRQRFPRSALWGMAPLFSSDKKPVPVDLISGACLMIRRDVFERIGGFSTDYFMYSEDVDICRKTLDAGWKCYYLPTASIIHFNGQSTKKQFSYFSTVVQQQSRFIYFGKMRGHFYAYCYRVLQFLAALLRIVLIRGLQAVSFNVERRSQLRYSAGKWTSILRWSLGLRQPARATSTMSRMVVSS